MSPTSNSSTNQHYVPQLLLRGFATPRTEQVYVFDKQTAKVFRSCVRNLACERGFYDLDDDGDPERLDRWLRRLEEQTAPIIKSLRSQRPISQLHRMERQWIAAFVAVQYVRTRHHRELWVDFNRRIPEALREMGTDPNKVENFRGSTEAEVRHSSIEGMPGLAFTVLPHLIDKVWILLSAAPGNTFWVGDHPVVLDNILNPGGGIRGTLGFGVRGIEVYLPISSEVTLGCLCQTIPALFADAKEPAKEFLAAFAGGATLELDAESVKYYNSLQVICAERFIFSLHNDFDMAREMLASHPDLRKGQRVEIANWPRPRQA